MAGSKQFAVRHRIATRGNCRFLLLILLALLVAFPFLEDVTRPLFLVMPPATKTVARVVVVEAGRADVRRSIAIAAVQIGLTATSLIDRERHSMYWVSLTLALAATTVLILFSTYCVLRYVLRARVITLDQIYAAICMYLMLGFAFGAVYYLVSILDPHSFSASGEAKPDLMYFSFVTLATLGYGDITPRTNISRSLAVVEALVGMLYIAIFMARLVSAHSESSE